MDWKKIKQALTPKKRTPLQEAKGSFLANAGFLPLLFLFLGVMVYINDKPDIQARLGLANYHLLTIILVFCITTFYATDALAYGLKWLKLRRGSA